jgi:uncharacterized protein YjbJ (UPF0337 family)
MKQRQRRQSNRELDPDSKLHQQEQPWQGGLDDQRDQDRRFEQAERQQLDTDYDLKPSLQKQAKTAPGSDAQRAPSREGSIPMHRDIAEGQWTQLKGRIRQQWSRLTEDEVERLQGSYERLIGKVQEKYGKAREDASREVNQFLDKFEQERRSGKTEPVET